MKSKIIFWLLSLVTIFGLSSCSEKTKEISNAPISKLKDYIQDRENFCYKLKDSFRLNEATLYRFKMNSGKWLTNKEVNEPLWWHWLDAMDLCEDDRAGVVADPCCSDPDYSVGPPCPHIKSRKPRLDCRFVG